MPTYEYRCPDGHKFDKLQKISEKPRTRCPVCGKTAARQISGGAALVFKGSGFYITDYGKDGKGARKPGEGEQAPAAEKSADKSTDKSADKAADKAATGKGDAKGETKGGSKADTASPSGKTEKAPKKAAE